MKHKKKALSLALMSFVPIAHAQSNVTIYGVADVSAQGFSLMAGKAGNYSATSGSAAEGNTFNLQSNSSLLGFRGGEAIGGSTKVLFQAETTLNMVGGGAVRVNDGVPFGGLRDSFVGLSGEYGVIRAGYNSMPIRAL